MNGSHAKVIADSVSAIDGVRLTTFEIRFRRFVLAEFNTHRTLSRNSASSRAIPFDRQVERMIADLAYPEVWPAEQRGMQGGQSLSDLAVHEAEIIWLGAAQDIIEQATRLRHLGQEGKERLHKSVVNRLLEPYMWHTVVATATAWENFFDQRSSPLAQPEIRVASDLMRHAYNASTPSTLEPGQWHLPYVDGNDSYDVALSVYGSDLQVQRSKTDLDRIVTRTLAEISASRCAQLSYLTQPVVNEDGQITDPGGKRNIASDLDRYSKLISAKPTHWSPLEHTATPWPQNRQHEALSFGTGEVVHFVETGHLPRVGNLLGWRSLRTTVEAETEQITYR